MSDFDRVFDPQYAAVDLFTNRTDENATFALSMVRHLERLSDGTASLSNWARHHVLTFYGVGGIGKTELSRRLERWALGELPENDEWGATPQLGLPVRTMRIDFHGSAAVQATDIVLRLRAALADSGKRFPAFDVGFAAWWALAHPGIALPDLRSPSGFDVQGQINDTLNEVLNEVGANFGLGPMTVRSGRIIVDAVRSRRLRTKALRECGPLAAIVEEARLDASPYVAASLAGLLSWDFERLAGKQRPLLIIFADAAEYIQGSDRSQERLFNRIVHLTPGFLWVVTSRRALDWDSTDLAALLPTTGPSVWPGIRLGEVDEPRQHLVGDLSDEDVERFLAAASEAPGNPVLNPDVRERIRRAAHGLPLYLDLSLAMARAMGGAELDAEVFGKPLPQLVTRVFADLPPEEREIARTASLVARFDPELLAQATGGLLGDALRFCERSLVSYDGHPLFPYRLHDAVRSAIAAESPAIPGAWAPADRRNRAIALAEALHARHDQALHGVEQRLDIVEITGRLCADHDLTLPWLLTSVIDLPSFEQTVERLPEPSDSTWIGLLATFLNAWHGRTIEERVAYLTDFVATPLPQDIGRTARRWLAYSLRSVYEHPAALVILEELLAETPESQHLLYQTARSLHGLGRYRDLKSHLENYPVTGNAADVRLQADLCFDRAELNQAIAGTAARASYLRSIGKHRIATDNDAMVVWRKALAGQASIAECDALADTSDQYGRSLTYRTALAARLLCMSVSHPRLAETLADRAAVIETSGSTEGWREYTADLIQALRRGDRAAISDIRAHWIASRTPWTPNQQLIDRICVFGGHPPVFAPPRFADEDSDAIDHRWHTVLTTLTDPDAGSST
ncbi:hypothetical protein [Actinomadura latina]|uniref:ATP/GTP-binding protein n=1 Tax=Actinomadura latina TaxID=163603 RepID=A0A846Z804_9ACTN|nr:hypothetical protein [Actinomadura latina]NKZ09229.1 hypothetical protein [Actinomadura latina]